MKSFCR